MFRNVIVDYYERQTELMKFDYKADGKHYAIMSIAVKHASFLAKTFVTAM
jgi:hypothetical protein